MQTLHRSIMKEKLICLFFLDNFVFFSTIHVSFRCEQRNIQAYFFFAFVSMKDQGQTREVQKDQIPFELLSD